MPAKDEPEQLDRIEIRDVSHAVFAAWLYRYKRRWMDGEPIRVLLARDRSHAIAVLDPERARRPPAPTRDEQLDLFGP